ncbi:hypothetical protein JXA88_02240 [Candidatus Fermentibacteria bacterium]|nr:hypothetical protein [Candidatus Fermentibacteria bacterium]
MDRRYVAGALAGIFVASAIIRMPGLGSQPLWTDEANCLAIARLKPAAAWHALEHDCSPPLYYWLLGSVAGDDPGEARTRALSAAFGLLTPPLLGLCGAWLMGPPGVVAGALLAVSPLHLWHSQEARMYALVCLLGVALACLTIRSRREGRGLAALAAVQILLLWTHHFSSFAIAVSWCIIGAARTVPWRRLLAFALVVAVGWLPAAVLLWRQVFVFRTGTWLPPPSLDAPLRSIGLWLAGIDAAEHSCILGIPMGLATVVLGALPLLMHGLRDSMGRMLATLCGGTLALAWIVSRMVPALVPGRYDIVVLPSFLLVLAAGWRRAGRAIRWASSALLMAGCAVGVFYYFTAYEKGSLRELAALIEENQQAHDVVVVAPEIEAPVLHYYYRGNLPVLVPPSFGTVDRVDYAHYDRRWASEDEARLLASECWARVPPGGRIHLIYSPYRATIQFKGWLMKGVTYTRITRRVSGSGSTELAVLERSSLDEDGPGAMPW